jgi:hypothetical protein
MGCMFFAETAILAHLNPVRGVLFVLECIVIALFAFGASKHDAAAGFFGGHWGTPLSIGMPLLLWA